VVWFAINEDRPLFAFGGLWTEFKGDRGYEVEADPRTSSDGFLTMAPNALVEPLHPRPCL
jgi:putative SOS response-associated peptidase YedK